MTKEDRSSMGKNKKSMDPISLKRRLIALNAAWEAARMGYAGMDFFAMAVDESLFTEMDQDREKGRAPDIHYLL